MLNRTFWGVLFSSFLLEFDKVFYCTEHSEKNQERSYLLIFSAGYHTFCAPGAKQERILVKVKDKILKNFFKLKMSKHFFCFIFYHKKPGSMLKITLHWGQPNCCDSPLILTECEQCQNASHFDYLQVWL